MSMESIRKLSKFDLNNTKKGHQKETMQQSKFYRNWWDEWTFFHVCVFDFGFIFPVYFICIILNWIVRWVNEWKTGISYWRTFVRKVPYMNTGLVVDLFILISFKVVSGHYKLYIWIPTIANESLWFWNMQTKKKQTSKTHRNTNHFLKITPSKTFI